MRVDEGVYCKSESQQLGDCGKPIYMSVYEGEENMTRTIMTRLLFKDGAPCDAWADSPDGRRQSF